MPDPKPHRLQRYRATCTRLAREVVPSAAISGATAGTTTWLLSLLTHHT